MRTFSYGTGCLAIFVLFHVPKALATDSPYQDPTSHTRRAQPTNHGTNLNIRALFQVSPGQTVAYPPLDVAGPKPRQSWLDAYHRAKQAGLIPAIPLTKVVDGDPVYPSWYKGNPCSYSINKCNRTEDINYPPSGIVGLSFDDGPQPPSRALLAFLTKNSQQATHFLIGSRIVSNPAVFAELDQSKQHMACHTWAHPMLTSLTDEGIVGELGWVMQVMYDETAKHKLCKYWRPPYGELDDRVRAIARHVFGLTVVTWSQDPTDWCLADTVPNGSVCGVGNGPQSLVALKAQLYKWAIQSRSKGLMILHHEQSTRAILGFKYIYPIMKRLGWAIKAVPEFRGGAWYQ